jgi:hypothetical protein
MFKSLRVDMNDLELSSRSIARNTASIQRHVCHIMRVPMCVVSLRHSQRMSVYEAE